MDGVEPGILLGGRLAPDPPRCGRGFPRASRPNARTFGSGTEILGNENPGFRPWVQSAGRMRAAELASARRRVIPAGGLTRAKSVSNPRQRSGQLAATSRSPVPERRKGTGQDQGFAPLRLVVAR